MKKIILTALAISLFSCSSEESSDNPSTSDLNLVKAVGENFVTSNSTENIYLDNGQVSSLSSLLYSPKIFTKGSDVYITGLKPDRVEPNNSSKAIGGYYKNGNFVELGAGYVLTDMLVDDNNDVHLCGYGSINGGGTPYYWKNTQRTQLYQTGTTSIPGKAVSIAKSGNDIYIAGQLSNTLASDLLGYWKNGVFNGVSLVNYYSGGYHPLIPLDVVGSDVYLVYYKGGNHYMYKNNASTVIEDFVGVSKIKWNNNKLYIAGTFYENDVYKIGYKIDGVKTIISDTENSSIWDFAIKGDDVYFSGSLNNKAAIWKNKVLLNKPTDFVRNSKYTSIGF